MSFKQTLYRILLILRGETPPEPPVTVSTTTPAHNDSKETLALKWEKKIAPLTATPADPPPESIIEPPVWPEEP